MKTESSALRLTAKSCNCFAFNHKTMIVVAVSKPCGSQTVTVCWKNEVTLQVSGSRNLESKSGQKKF